MNPSYNMDWNKTLLLTKMGIFFALDLVGIIGTAGMATTMGILGGMATNPVFGVCMGLTGFGAGMVGRRWVCGEYARLFMPELTKNETFDKAVEAMAAEEKQRAEDEADEG